MVFGARLAESIQAGVDGPEPSGALATTLAGPRQPVDPSVAAPWTARTREAVPAAPTWPDVAKSRDRLQRTMMEGAGVVRTAGSLAGAGATVEALGTEMAGTSRADRAHGELVNLLTAAACVLRSATVRCETRGAHARRDHPDTSDRWRRRIVHDRGEMAVVAGPDVPGPADRSST
jgi:L-aspartate oxidase